MVEKQKFRDYESYVDAQRKTVARRQMGPYFTDCEMLRISKWLRMHGVRVKEGICHGARNGLECDELLRHFPQARIFGTDLFPHSGKSIHSRGKSDVVEWDFNKPNECWLNKFQLIYSNSLDHAMDPEETLKVWLAQLAWDGVIFVQWNRSDLAADGGDCFGATPLEMIDLCRSVGRLCDLLYVDVEWQKANRLRHHALECIVYVLQRKRAGGIEDVNSVSK
jgi:hypothetical protein